MTCFPTFDDRRRCRCLPSRGHKSINGGWYAQVRVWDKSHWTTSRQIHPPLSNNFCPMLLPNDGLAMSDERPDAPSTTLLPYLTLTCLINTYRGRHTISRLVPERRRCTPLLRPNPMLDSAQKDSKRRSTVDAHIGCLSGNCGLTVERTVAGWTCGLHAPIRQHDVLVCRFMPVTGSRRQPLCQQ